MGTIFKGLFWVFVSFWALLIAVALLATRDAVTSLGVIIPLAIIGWIVFRNRARRKAPAEQSSRQRLPSASQASENIIVGHGAQVEVRDTGISITRNGAASLVLHGLKGEKRFAYSSITAIQFRDATKMMSGYIQFSILGGNESRTGIWDATKDENTVMFTFEQSASFQKLRDLVEARMQPSHSSLAHPAPSTADEITKLAGLHERGYLSDEEFASQKAALLKA